MSGVCSLLLLYNNNKQNKNKEEKNLWKKCKRIIYYSFVIDIKQQNKMAENHIMVRTTRYCHKFTLKTFLVYENKWFPSRFPCNKNNILFQSLVFF